MTENIAPSTLVETGSRLFRVLEQCTPGRILMRLFHRHLYRGYRYGPGDRGYLFRDRYNQILLVASVLVTLAIPVYQRLPSLEVSPSTKIILQVLILWRIYEILVLQVNVMLFDHYRASREALAQGTPRPFLGGHYKLRSYRRRVIEALFYYAETVFWFALLYFIFRRHFFVSEELLQLDHVEADILASIQVMSGFGSVAPTTTTGAVIAIMHSVIGILLTVVIVSFTISLLGSVRLPSADPTETEYD